ARHRGRDAVGPEEERPVGGQAPDLLGGEGSEHEPPRHRQHRHPRREDEGVGHAPVVLGIGSSLVKFSRPMKVMVSPKGETRYTESWRDLRAGQKKKTTVTAIWGKTSTYGSHQLRKTVRCMTPPARPRPTACWRPRTP